MKILVVDDEKLLVKGIKFNLEQDGYAVVTAFDGEEAIRLAHDESKIGRASCRERVLPPV